MVGLPGMLGSRFLFQTMIVYGASWCGACHEAMAYMKKKGIPFVEKDIEKDPGAEREMRSKLAHAGMNTGSIPILDVRGTPVIRLWHVAHLANKRLSPTAAAFREFVLEHGREMLRQGS